MTTPAIKYTFELFREPFDKANINRDHALALDSTAAAGTARLQYLAQIIASIVSVPFLILAGLVDLVNGKCTLLGIPTAIFSQLFITLPVSILGALLPMSWSQGIDTSFAQYTRDRFINAQINECLPYLEMRLHEENAISRAHGRPTIGTADLEDAIQKKTILLNSEAHAVDLRQLQANVLAMPIGSMRGADLYETLKLKENHLNGKSHSTFQHIYGSLAAAAPDTAVHKDWSEALARKRAAGPETIATLRDLLRVGKQILDEPNPANHAAIIAAAAPLNPAAIQAAANPIDQAAIASAIVKKYTAAHTYQELRHLLPAPTAEEQAMIEAAIQEKESSVLLLATCETMEDLFNPPAGNRILVDLYAYARNQKNLYLDQLAALPLAQLLAELANSRNPVELSNLSGAIIRNYYQNNCYSALHALVTRAPAPAQLLVLARDRKDAYLETQVRQVAVDLLEAALEQTAPVPPAQASNDHKDAMEILARKYVLYKTWAELEAMVAPGAPVRHPTIIHAARVAIQRKGLLVRGLVQDRSLAGLIRAHGAERNEVQKDLLAIARDHKQAEIDRLCATLSWRRLNEEWNRAPLGTMGRTNLEEAVQQKNDILLAQMNMPLEDMRAQLAQIPEDQVVQRHDMLFLIQSKEQQIAARVAAAPLPHGAAH